MNNLNKKVQKLIITNDYYVSIKRKKINKYWYKKKDPDGNVRDRIKNFKEEKKRFIKNNKDLLDLIKSLNFKSLCDVGCGPGFLLSAINHKQLFGIENDKSAILKASKYAKIFDIDLNKSFNLKQNIDVVVCYHVIEHIKNPKNFIKNLKKIIKKNGYLIIGTPDFDSAMARVYKNNYRMLYDKTHISLFSMESLLRFLKSNRLKILKVDYPYFNTTYFNKKNLLQIFNKKSISPPFYGNFITVLARKLI